jgi:hypothetical protein
MLLADYRDFSLKFGLHRRSLCSEQILRGFGSFCQRVGYWMVDSIHRSFNLDMATALPESQAVVKIQTDVSIFNGRQCKGDTGVSLLAQ